jgi:hypothetical protein
MPTKKKSVGRKKSVGKKCECFKQDGTKCRNNAVKNGKCATHNMHPGSCYRNKSDALAKRRGARGAARSPSRSPARSPARSPRRVASPSPVFVRQPGVRPGLNLTYQQPSNRVAGIIPINLFGTPRPPSFPPPRPPTSAAPPGFRVFNNLNIAPRPAPVFTAAPRVPPPSAAANIVAALRGESPEDAAREARLRAAAATPIPISEEERREDEEDAAREARLRAAAATPIPISEEERREDEEEQRAAARTGKRIKWKEIEQQKAIAARGGLLRGTNFNLSPVLQAFTEPDLVRHYVGATLSERREELEQSAAAREATNTANEARVERQLEFPSPAPSLPAVVELPVRAVGAAGNAVAAGVAATVGAANAVAHIVLPTPPKAATPVPAEPGESPQIQVSPRERDRLLRIEATMQELREQGFTPEHGITEVLLRAAATNHNSAVSARNELRRYYK